MKALPHIFIIFVISSFLISGCGAVPALPPTAFPSTTPASTETHLPTATSVPTVVQPKKTTLPPGVLAIVPVAPGPITLAASTDSIWVESHRNDIVTRVDPLQNKEVARLKDAPVHCKVSSGGGFVWATEAWKGTVTKIDPESRTVVGSIEQLTTPCGIAADKTDLWVTNPGDGEVVRYDAATLEELAVIPLGKDIFEVEIGPDAVWVTGESGGGTVWRIDPATNQVVTSISISDSTPICLVVAFDSVWVGSRTKGLIYRIDTATNAITETIKVNDSIGGIGVGPDAIWASGFGDGTIYKIDPATNSVLGSLPTRFSNLGPPLVAFDSIWVGALDQDVVLRIDPAAFDGLAATVP